MCRRCRSCQLFVVCRGMVSCLRMHTHAAALEPKKYGAKTTDLALAEPEKLLLSQFGVGIAAQVHLRISSKHSLSTGQKLSFCSLCQLVATIHAPSPTCCMHKSCTQSLSAHCKDAGTHHKLFFCAQAMDHKVRAGEGAG